MSAELPARRTVVYHAAPQAFVPHALAMMTRLGYRMIAADELGELGDDAPAPDLRIVDERRLAEVAEEAPEAAVPIIVVGGRDGVTGVDSRILGAVHRPAGLHELYRLFQSILEETPRSTPRVPTHLAAVCRHRADAWRVAMLSLSENGCLIRSPTPLALGACVDLSFTLPGGERIETEAQASYQLVPDLGLVFHGIRSGDRERIAHFVGTVLAEL
jgi:hypothetical protein